jgi:asparagine synthase (glutamine-hydrolysing)
MCGIFFSHANVFSSKENIHSLDFLSHRGPDEQIIYRPANDPKSIYGFTRLSIRAKKRGGQPYKYDEIISMINGELFNEAEVLQDLSRLDSNLELPEGDMQILGLALIKFGPEYLGRCRGQFAGVLHFTSCNKLLMFRDFVGEKPLFYRVVDSKIVQVCSEARFDLFESPQQPTIRARDVIMGYYNSENDPYIFEVPPRSFIQINLSTMELSLSYYDELPQRVKASDKKSLSNRLLYFENILSESVKYQLIADDGVDILLSGGVDSYIILYFAQKYAGKKIKTYTVGFTDKDYDESKKAQVVADFFGVENQLFLFDHEELAASINQVIQFMDVPILDPACIPLFNLLQRIKGSTRCVLTGDGGDEIVRGYKLYKYIDYIDYLCKLPITIKRALPYIFTLLPVKRLHNYQNLQFKVDRVIDILKLDYMLTEEIALSPLAGTPIFQIMCKNLFEKESSLKLSGKTRLELYYLQKILPNLYLRKADRMGMANSVELRAPLLDSKVIKNAFNFSPKELHQLGSKGPITFLAKKYLPSQISNQEKHGFSFKFNDIKKFLKRPIWELNDLGLSSESCDEVWFSDKNNYNQSLASWTLFVLNEFRSHGRINFK